MSTRISTDTVYSTSLRVSQVKVEGNIRREKDPATNKFRNVLEPKKKEGQDNEYKPYITDVFLIGFHYWLLQLFQGVITNKELATDDGLEEFDDLAVSNSNLTSEEIQLDINAARVSCVNEIYRLELLHVWNKSDLEYKKGVERLSTMEQKFLNSGKSEGTIVKKWIPIQESEALDKYLNNVELGLQHYILSYYQFLTSKVASPVVRSNIMRASNPFYQGISLIYGMFTIARKEPKFKGATILSKYSSIGEVFAGVTANIPTFKEVIANRDAEVSVSSTGQGRPTQVIYSYRNILNVEERVNLTARISGSLKQTLRRSKSALSLHMDSNY